MIFRVIFRITRMVCCIYGLLMTAAFSLAFIDDLSRFSICCFSSGNFFHIMSQRIFFIFLYFVITAICHTFIQGISLLCTGRWYNNSLIQLMDFMIRNRCRIWCLTVIFICISGIIRIFCFAINNHGISSQKYRCRKCQCFYKYSFPFHTIRLLLLSFILLPIFIIL